MRWIFFLVIVSLVIFSNGYSLQEIIVQETENVSLHPDIFDPDGDELTYTFGYPLDSQGKWQTKYGDAGTYNVTITVSDGMAIATENISLIVKKKEEVPIFEKIQPNLDTMDIKENDVMRFNIEVHDLNNDQLQYTWLLNDEYISNQNSITFQPGYESSGNYKLVVKVSDGINEISEEWEINVLNVDRKPIFLPIVPITLNEAQEIEIVLNASDTDGDKISYSAENLPKSAILSENIFFWKPNYDTVKKESLLDIMRDNYHILDRLFIIEFIAKSKELSTRQSAIIRVNDVNRPPIIEESEPIIVNEGDIIKIIPEVFELDGDKVSISYGGWMSSDSYKTTFDDAGRHNVIITASDGWKVVSKEINITVLNVNRAPIFKNIAPIDIFENETMSIYLTAEDPDNDPTTFSIKDSEKYGGIFISQNILRWTPDFNVVEKETNEIKIPIIASDGELNSSQELLVNVHNSNRAPEIISTNPGKNLFAYKGKSVRFEVIAEDPDNDDLTYKWKLGTFEEYTGSRKLSRKFNELGRKKISVIVSDGDGEATFEWDVNVI